MNFSADGFISGTGFNALAAVDASTQPGSDWGAKVNAAIALLPATGGVVNAINFSGTPAMFTSVAPTIPVVILMGAYNLQQHASFVLTNNCAIIGLAGAGGSLTIPQVQGSVITKVASMAAQIEFFGSNIIIDSILLVGGAGAFTGAGTECGILIDAVTAGSPPGGQASYCIIKNTTIDSSDGDAITDNGGIYNQAVQSNIQYYGANGYNTLSGAFFSFVGCTFNDNGPTGSPINNGGFNSDIFITNCFVIGNGTSPAINANQANVGITGSVIEAFSGNSCFSNTTGFGTTQINNTTFFGGGVAGSPATSNPVIDCVSVPFFMTDCQINGQGINGDSHGVSLSSCNPCLISDCQIQNNFTSGGFATLYLTGDSLGFDIHDNQIQIGVGSTPSTKVYGIWYQASGGHAIMAMVMNNTFLAANVATAYPIFWDNSNNVGTNGGHTIAHNKFIDVNNGVGCILRDDPNGYMATLIFDNLSQDAPVFAPPANSPPVSTGLDDTIVQFNGAYTYSTLPAAGNGSFIVVNNATPTNPIRNQPNGGNAPGSTIALRLGTSWVACSSPVVAQANSTGIASTTGVIHLIPAAAAGEYLITWNAKITTPAGVSSTLGPLTLGWVDPDGVSQTLTCAAQLENGTIATSTTGNITTSSLIGLPVLLNVQAGSLVSYNLTLTSSGSAPAANFNICAEIR